MNNSKKVLVLGSTGYVGGRLIPKLLEEGFQVRAGSRSIKKLESRFWASHSNVELVEVDVQDKISLRKALDGIDVAYYMVHSMNPQSKDFEEADRIAAQNMADLSRDCGVKRIIYLGGLGEDGKELSKHLKSRHEVSEILQQGAVPVTVLRAAMIIGSGSASFEILRYLVDRLPIMITPRWVNTPNQPIAIRNVIEYLYGCLIKEETSGQIYDIGGKEVVTYLQLMRIYAQEAHLNKRLIIPVPVLTPKLSSLWIHLVTPVPSYIAMPLAEGLRNPVVCRDKRIELIVPQDLFDCREAIQLALRRISTNDVQSFWTDAGKLPSYSLTIEGDPKWAGGTVMKDIRCCTVKASKEKVWEIIKRIGGTTGWYHGTWLWILRGFLDRLIGGVGLRRGRRDPVQIAVGDVLDFWRVSEVVENEKLVLSAEMKLPGEAVLSFVIKPINEHSCELIQDARFIPRGLAGIVYWYCIFPLHEYVFGGMIKKIAQAAEG